MKPDIEHLKDFAKKFNRVVVVTFSIDPKATDIHITTYGANRKLCRLAGAFGSRIGEAIQSGAIAAPEVEPANSGLMSYVPDPADARMLELRCHCGGKMTAGSWKANGTCLKCIEDEHNE